MGSRLRKLTCGYLNRSTPGYLIFFVTPLCDCRCPMCFNRKVIDQAAGRKTLTLEEIQKISVNFPGLHHVNFSGGEPFLRTDFRKIPRLFYQNSGTRMFAIPTNSSRPGVIVESIREICTDCPDAWIRITQSLDGIGEDHDRIRGKAGLFDRVVELNRSLQELRKEFPNLSNGIAMVMSKYNEGKEYAILDYVYANLACDDFGALYVRGDTYDPAAREVGANAYADFVRACRERALERQKKIGMTGRLFSAINAVSTDLLVKTVCEDRFMTYCRAGKNRVIMDDEGTVSPCEMLQYYIDSGRAPLKTAAFGNVRNYDYDIRKLLSTEHAGEIIRYIRESRCYCTFECAMTVNVLYSPCLWPRVLRHL